MASPINPSDSFIPFTKEFLVIQKYFSRLHHVIDDPVSLAVSLFSAGLISDGTMMKASCETNCVIVRNYYLLNGMKGAIVCDPNNLIKIISILEDYPPLDSIAQEMKTDHGNNLIALYNLVIKKTASVICCEKSQSL